MGQTSCVRPLKTRGARDRSITHSFQIWKKNKCKYNYSGTSAPRAFQVVRKNLVPGTRSAHSTRVRVSTFRSYIEGSLVLSNFVSCVYHVCIHPLLYTVLGTYVQPVFVWQQYRPPLFWHFVLSMSRRVSYSASTTCHPPRAIDPQHIVVYTWYYTYNWCVCYGRHNVPAWPSALTTQKHSPKEQKQKTKAKTRTDKKPTSTHEVALPYSIPTSCLASINFYCCSCSFLRISCPSCFSSQSPSRVRLYVAPRHRGGSVCMVHFTSGSR